jgi:hypothetical protein
MKREIYSLGRALVEGLDETDRNRIIEQLVSTLEARAIVFRHSPSLYVG